MVGEGPKKCIPAASFPVTSVRRAGVMYNVLSGLAACGRLGVAARPACLFGTRPVARDQ